MHWRLSAWIWISALVVSAITAFITFEIQAVANPSDRCICDIDMNTTGRGTAQLFADLNGVNQGSSNPLPLAPPGEFTSYRFYFPAVTCDRLRFEPFQGKGQATIGRVRIADPNDETLFVVSPDHVLPLKDVAAVERSGIGNHILSTGANVDPAVAFVFDEPVTIGHSKGASMLLSALIALVSFPLWALTIGFVSHLNSRAA